MPDYARPNRAIASSPIPVVRPASEPQVSQQDVHIRQMRLKVLYTFDDDKTNCLARWPQPVDIRTAFLNSDTQVGVIELRTCLQAIAAASPEIVAGLGQDYTVYAYDYSEYETPLVGQGMLSWILASASPTPGAPAHQSRTMVTGRVCQNALGLFGSGSQETLEVKLRLVPVPTSRQSEYIESMKRYRDVSQTIPPGFDPQSWIMFLQQNPGFSSSTVPGREQSPSQTQASSGGFGLENVQRLLNSLNSQTCPSQPLSQPSSFISEPAQQPARPSSPASSIASNPIQPKKRGRKPGPNYKGPRPKPKAPKTDPPLESIETGYTTADERNEDGSLKKRAKVVQAEWPGKQEFGKQQDSLRVVASTAASVRIHQPTAVRPGANAHLELENQPRAPTPVAGPGHLPRKSRLSTSQSALGRLAMSAGSPPAETPAFSPTGNSERGSETSPEKSAAESSPADIGSSPPNFPGDLTAASSPRLPEFPRSFEDSGFMSGTFDDLFEDDGVLSKSNFSTVHNDISQQAEPFTTLQQQPQHQSNDSSASSSFVNFQHNTLTPMPDMTDQSAASRHTLARASSTGNLGPQIPASDPVPPRELNRSQSWTGMHPASDNTGSDSKQERPVSLMRPRRQSDMGGQSGLKRRAVIQSKLASSIASGEMPPFCDNCGAIETPTWRKAWSKVHSGTPEHVRLSADEGGVLAWQTLQTDNKGEICLYRIIKKSLSKGEDGFTEMLLCNPCGMYLYTRKCMRPKEMWDNKPQKGPEDKSKKKPGGKGPASGSGTHTRSASAGHSQRGPHSEPSSPGNTYAASDAVEGEPQLPAVRKRRMSQIEFKSPQKHIVLDEAAAAAALERAIMSSPHHQFVSTGSQQAPIEVGDLTPKPTRRLLFPSPSKSGGSQTQSTHPSAYQAQSPTPQVKPKDQPSSGKDDIDRFFSEEGYAAQSSQSQNHTSPSKLPELSTPARPQSHHHRPPTTGEIFSAAKALLHAPSTPRLTPSKGTAVHNTNVEMTPFTANLNQFLSDAAQGSCPTDGTDFDFPALPSLRNTPNGKGHDSSGALYMDLDFAGFDSQDLISTDIPMPSSPPPWNFGTYVEGDGGGGGGGGEEEGVWSGEKDENGRSEEKEDEERRDEVMSGERKGNAPVAVA